MPSQSRLTFERFLLKDVEKLIEKHRLEFVGQGRPLSVYTRSGIFLLCAAWELYIEEATREGSTFIVQQTASPAALSDSLRATLAGHVRTLSPEEALQLSGTGWRGIINEIVESHTNALNTPNFGNVCKMVRTCTGLNLLPLLGPETAKIDLFVSKRGDIAHRGAAADHVSINDLSDDYSYICNLVARIDNELADQIRVQVGDRPWNKRN